MDDATFVCPRCETTVSENFYGPCNSCREALRQAHTGAARQVEVAAYEPSMNVVPNQVATKE